MSNARLTTAADGSWRVAGALLMQTVPDVLEASRELPPPASGIIDLAEVDRIDSSAVALLLEWMRVSAERQGQIRYRNLPPDLLSIARLCGVEDLLPIEGEMTRPAESDAQGRA